MANEYNALVQYLFGRRKEQDKLREAPFGGRPNAPIPPPGYVTEVDYEEPMPDPIGELPQAIGAGYMPEQPQMPALTGDPLVDELIIRQWKADQVQRNLGQY
jgi:hypothetical protein